ncbi:MAG TPA: NepR family anti-sigma factor [Rhizomicrobium sp.]|jgi:hypothetical protein|nr:NepR family anti-sigma factor [Rhizomicrobium sp.]
MVLSVQRNLAMQSANAMVSEEDNPEREKARAIRARQRAIGRELRRMFDEVAQEPVPQDFLELLNKIDEGQAGKKAS